MNNLPSGTVTFLFTDIEGSTPLWEKNSEAMKGALAKHDSLLRGIFQMHNGQIVKITGDGFHVAFLSVGDAVQAAIHSQQALQKESWGEAIIKVRMGLHTGEAELRDGDYFGHALNLAARVMSAGHGNQALVSSAIAELIRGSLPANQALLDLGEHHLKGLTRAERIFQLVAPDLQKEFPALMSIATATNNLPTQLTSFIGREKEIREAKEKLSSAKLLTLIGPGGTGKTRLSIQLGQKCFQIFGWRWFIELAPLADPALILQTIASVLNVRAQMGGSLKDIVIDYLRAKNILLIFDNCEHLVEASAQLADEFLHHAPKIKIIASSREALGIGGETIYRVPSLSLPNQAQASREALAGFESIQLFVERARAANPKFDLTEKNASAVAQICRRLDGIPLALELAAARVTVFPPEQIASRLDDRFKLLTGGSRTALPRQQTLRALIDWSYDCSAKTSARCYGNSPSLRAAGYSKPPNQCVATRMC
jgi:class 3 adenylate cyclase